MMTAITDENTSNNSTNNANSDNTSTGTSTSKGSTSILGLVTKHDSRQQPQHHHNTKNTTTTTTTTNTRNDPHLPASTWRPPTPSRKRRNKSYSAVSTTTDADTIVGSYDWIRSMFRNNYNNNDSSKYNNSDHYDTTDRRSTNNDIHAKKSFGNANSGLLHTLKNIHASSSSFDDSLLLQPHSPDDLQLHDSDFDYTKNDIETPPTPSVPMSLKTNSPIRKTNSISSNSNHSHYDITTTAMNNKSNSNNEDHDLNSDYQMMKSQHGPQHPSNHNYYQQPSIPNNTSSSSHLHQKNKQQIPSSEEDIYQQCNFFYNDIETHSDTTLRNKYMTNMKTSISSSRRNHDLNTSSPANTLWNPTRFTFLKQHQSLNAYHQFEQNISDDDIDDDDDDDYDDDDNENDIHGYYNPFYSNTTPRKRTRHTRKPTLPISDISKSSLSYLHRGKIQIRLPTDNVRLLMDPFLEPGILCVESDEHFFAAGNRRNSGDGGGGGGRRNNSTTMFGNVNNSGSINREIPSSPTTIYNQNISSSYYDTTNSNIDSKGRQGQHPTVANSILPNPFYLKPPSSLSTGSTYPMNEQDIPSVYTSVLPTHPGHNIKPPPTNCTTASSTPTPPCDLNYILTVDEDLYKRIFQEMSDSYKLPCGLYYCCYDSVDDSKHVNIGIAICILGFVFMLMIIAISIWPLD